MNSVRDKILKLRLERNWTEYDLAKMSGLTQSTISSWYKKHMTPSVASLETVCDAFGITISQFFAESELMELTSEQVNLLNKWAILTNRQKQAILDIIISVPIY